MGPATATILGALITTAAQGIGGWMNSRENKRLQDEARGLDARNFAETQKSNRFNQGMARKEFGLREDQLDLQRGQLGLQRDRFGLEKGMSQYKVMQNEIGKLEKLLNTNIGLQNMVLGRWGSIGGRG